MNLISYFLFFLLITCFSISGFSQTPAKPQLNENSAVYDSTGMKYPYLLWRKLMGSGEYSIVSKKDNGVPTGEYLLVKLSEDALLKRKEASKPRETPYFTTGNRLREFSLRDLNNKKYKLKELKGKVVVLNFWFVNCGPCRKEIPDLNQLVEKYKKNADVVFLAIALDDYTSLKTFLKTNPYNYNIVADGRYDADAYGVKSYPTHVVLDRNATIVFHTNGLAFNTVHWVDKSIQEGLKSTVPASSNN